MALFKSKNLRTGASVLLSYILTFGIFKFFKIAFPLSELIFLTTMFAVVILTNRALSLLARKKLVLGSAIFSPFLAVSFVIGRKINLWAKPYFEYFEFIDLIYFALLTTFLFFVLLILMDFVCRTSLEIYFTEPKVSFKFWLTIFGIFAVAWVPYLLIYYPGILSPDSFSSINQSVGITPYNNHCPILFTLFVKVFIDFGLIFGDLNFAISCFSFAQILVLSAVLSYAVCWLKNKSTPKYILVLVTIFFACNPVIAMYSITMWKDVMFAGWMLLLILHLYDIMASDGQLLCSARGLIRLIVYCMLVAFGRNNGFYAVIAVLVALSMYFKQFWKFLIPASLSTILLISVIQGPVYKFAGVSPGHFAESVGIPLQQIGYTVSENGSISDKQQEFLNDLLPKETISGVFRPNSPDYIKFHMNFNNELLNENKVEFVKIWLSLLPSNFVKYVKAWLMQTLGYYHIGTTNWVAYDDVMEDYEGVYNTNLIPNIVSPSLQRAIPKYTNAIARNCPLIQNLYSIAFMVWTTFFCAVVLALKKRAKYIIVLLPLIAIWGTMMIAAPTFCEFRYMFSFHLALPFVVLLMFSAEEKRGQMSATR